MRHLFQMRISDTFAASAATTTNRKKVKDLFKGKKKKSAFDSTSAAPPGRPSSFPGKRLIRLLTALASVHVCVCVTVCVYVSGKSVATGRGESADIPNPCKLRGLTEALQLRVVLADIWTVTQTSKMVNVGVLERVSNKTFLDLIRIPIPVRIFRPCRRG